MPLIDHHEFKENDHGVENVIKIVVAVSFDVEFRSFQFRVPTIHLLFRQIGIAIELDHSLEDLHSDDGIDVVDDLM